MRPEKEDGLTCLEQTLRLRVCQPSAERRAVETKPRTFMPGELNPVQFSPLGRTEGPLHHRLQLPPGGFALENSTHTHTHTHR